MRENKQLTKKVTSATIGGNYETHEYDSIGNSIIASFNGATNTYSANNDESDYIFGILISPNRTTATGRIKIRVYEGKITNTASPMQRLITL